MNNAFVRKLIRCAIPALIATVAGLGVQQADAGTTKPYKVLHTFCRAADCRDGRAPVNQLAIDANDNLFGVAVSGGGRGDGTLFELTLGSNKYSLKLLRNFCNFGGVCHAGRAPESAPILDIAGNVYGTTLQNGNSTSCGTVYEVKPVSTPADGKPKFRAIYFFSGADGCYPDNTSLQYQGKDSGDAYDGTSPLFGMTSSGGANGQGAIFELKPPSKPNHKWTETVLYSFCQSDGCPDGAYPQGNFTMDASGNLFGGTSDGKVFELSPDGHGGYSYNVLYTSTTNEAFAQISVKPDGTLIGIAQIGGSLGQGTLFSLMPGGCRTCNGRGATGYQYTVLHDFCAGGSPCLDGLEPNSFVFDAIFNIYGTTYGGGANPGPPNDYYARGGGTVFEYNTLGQYSVLHNFCAKDKCVDGGVPEGGLSKDRSLNLFGTASSGGSMDHSSSGGGVVYELQP